MLNPKQTKTIQELTTLANRAGIVPKLKINLVSNFTERQKTQSKSVREREESVMTPEIQSQRYMAEKGLMSKRETQPKIVPPSSSHMRHKSALDAKPFLVQKPEPATISSVFKIREELKNMATKMYNTKTMKNSPGSMQAYLKTTPKSKYGFTKPSHQKTISISTELADSNLILET